ncbi:hypothetical protein LAZ67_6000151 [Cordylochernes scorpioides]|uniref:Histone-lysine N-methyltransferase SETMAR n=1 Tax=Cordylochernes scorpioides TaxID=51811 RepID=A0ABY6KIE3_9ARAC|nr:hypothetical protein LAZ67_6000151 [Cordylochernes scorpioides]
MDDSPRPKKIRSQCSAGKVLLTIFWDVDGPICLDFLSSRQRMNSDLYCDILVNKLKPGIRNKRRGKLSKGVLFLHDNARPHTSCKTPSTDPPELGFEVLQHPAYSPDLAPSDYFLFGLLKKELKGKRFDSDEDVQKVVQDFFHTLPKSAYKEGIYKLPERWRRCIESQVQKVRSRLGRNVGRFGDDVLLLDRSGKVLHSSIHLELNKMHQNRSPQSHHKIKDRLSPIVCFSLRYVADDSYNLILKLPIQ